MARSNNISKNHGTSDTKDGNSRSRCNKHKRRITAKILRIRQSMPDSKALNPVSGKSHSNKVRRDRLAWTVYSIACVKYTAPQTSQPITPTHTNRDCWVFKQAGKLIAENKDKGPHSDDEEEPRQPHTGGQKRFPPQVRTVNMI